MLRHFQLIAFDHMTCIGGSDVEGYVAVNGTTNISHYSISANMPPPSALELYTDAGGHQRTTRIDFVVCGDLWFASGAVNGGGNAVYTGNNSVIGTLASAVPPGVTAHVHTCPYDFDDTFYRLSVLSAGLASYVRTGTSVFQYT